MAADANRRIAKYSRSQKNLVAFHSTNAVTTFETSSKTKQTGPTHSYIIQFATKRTSQVPPHSNFLKHTQDNHGALHTR